MMYYTCGMLVSKRMYYISSLLKFNDKLITKNKRKFLDINSTNSCTYLEDSVFLKDRNKNQWIPINVGKFADNFDSGIVSKSGGTVNGNCCGDTATCS